MIKKLIIFSGIQPSGCITLGNYIGAIQQWYNLQNKNKYINIYMIADLHCLSNFTNNYKKLQSNILDTLALLLSCNINFHNNIIFLQSKILEHCNLFWFLNSYSYFNELLRMTQFKEKIIDNKIKKKIKISLFNYPILMAADILLYQPNYIPVGIDQKQHLELIDIIIKRINNKYYNPIFKIPKYLISNNKIMSLNNPKKKMSKSDNYNSYISLLDTQEEVNIKIKKAITDSEKKIYFDKLKKPSISNLLLILSKISNKSLVNLQLFFKNKNYNQLKSIIIKNINYFLQKIQKKYYKIRNNEELLKKILYIGNNKAKKIAKKNFTLLYKILGLS